MSVIPSYPPYYKYTPSLRDFEDFDAGNDAQCLRDALKGFGTDEKCLIAILAYRSNNQRQAIATEYKTMFGKSLYDDLKSETSGNFKKLLKAMMTPIPEFCAKEIHHAISGIGTDEEVLIEMLCTTTNEQINIIKAAYETKYGKSLEDAIVGDTSGAFRRMLVSLITANRDSSMDVDEEKATEDAQTLLDAGELKWGTDESTFNMILCQRNHQQLKAIFNEYARLAGHDIEVAIKDEFSGDCKEGLLAIIRSIRSRPYFFATQLHKSMAGLGTNDRQLIRIVATRSEIDMEDIKTNYEAKYEVPLSKDISDIKTNYEAKYEVPLSKDISGDCHGDYKNCLLALINDP